MQPLVMNGGTSITTYTIVICEIIVEFLSQSLLERDLAEEKQKEITRTTTSPRPVPSPVRFSCFFRLAILVVAVS